MERRRADMASEVKFKILLPNAALIDRARDEDIITRYMRSDFLDYSSDFVYYDTPGWDLCRNQYLLRVCMSGDMRAATLRVGHVEQKELPGLYEGQGWLTYFQDPAAIVEDFSRRGAYTQFADYASRGELAVRFSSFRKRCRVNLYLPERTRVDFCLDDGELRVDGKTEPLRHMALTLSYGDRGIFTNYCSQLLADFGLTADLHTLSERALRLHASH